MEAKLIKVTNAIVVKLDKNSGYFVSFRYDGIRENWKREQAETWRDRLQQALEHTEPNEGERIQIKLEGTNNPLLILRSDLLQIWRLLNNWLNMD